VPLAHFTLATRDIHRTAAFVEQTLGYARKPLPANVAGEAIWFDIGNGQEMHVLYAPGFEISAHEAEYGRHVAMFHPRSDFPALKARLAGAGAVLIDPVRPTPFERFFFREPVNGYVFEVIDEGVQRDRPDQPASHLDQ
jgi:Glyoxalase/Bleomycin resistance protein/Dioxygenase superfamily